MPQAFSEWKEGKHKPIEVDHAIVGKLGLSRDVLMY